MKKSLTVILVLALVFSVAGTAFAFTGISEQETSTDAKFSVKVELVDYNYGWKDGIYYNVPASRAYAINEAVGAVVTVVVPAKSDEAVELKISQSNMKILDIDSDQDPELVFADNKTTLAANAGTSNKTYKFFVTAQLKSEKGGSITAKVVDAEDDDDIESGIVVIGATALEFDVVLSGYEYTITALEDGENIVTDDALIIVVGRDYKCKTMKVYDSASTTEYTIATVNGKIAFKDGTTYVVSGDSEYSDLLKKYNELADEFGFDYAVEGYLYKSFFTKLNGSVTVSDTANVEPALPSSALLPDLAVTIPQTGSVSFAGIAMIALAVAAAVALKKAR